MNAKLRHVYIATPTHDGKLFAEYTQSLARTVALLLQSGVAYTIDFIMGNAIVQDARNRLVANFMASEATDLMFIDSDIAWPPEAVLALLESPHEVVGGAYRQKHDEGRMFNASVLKVTPSGLVECDFLGAGFLRVKRRAIDKMCQHYADKRYGDDKGNPVFGLFDVLIQDGKIVGEDAVFCRRWRDMGGKIFMAPNLMLGHVGRKIWVDNFADMYREASADGEAA